MAGRQAPAFWRATVKIEQPGDTFLDMRSWGKGVVWVNGHCMGRYWDIGPTQTMYVPGPWLKHGRNEIIILDLTGPENPVIGSLDHPILDELHPERDFVESLKCQNVDTVDIGKIKRRDRWSPSRLASVFSAKPLRCVRRIPFKFMLLRR
jgi:beta-galactosidase